MYIYSVRTHGNVPSQMNVSFPWLWHGDSGTRAWHCIGMEWNQQEWNETRKNGIGPGDRFAIEESP